MAFGEQALELGIFDHAVGLVVALALLVLDDADLVGQILLGDRAEQMAHPVALEVERPLERGARHGLEIIGAVEPGGAVEVGRAHRAGMFEIFARRVFGAVEHEVLEQVGEAGAAGRLVLGADIVPDADRDHRRLAVLVDDDAQAVGEREGLVRDVDPLDQLADRIGGGGAAAPARWLGGGRPASDRPAANAKAVRSLRM